MTAPSPRFLVAWALGAALVSGPAAGQAADAVVALMAGHGLAPGDVMVLARKRLPLGELQAELQATIDLVTAMFWDLQADNLTHEQIAAARHDRVLGVLWARIWDYAAYHVAHGNLIRSIARDDEASAYLLQYWQRFSAEVNAGRQGRPGPLAPMVEEVREKAIKGTPRARAMRRKYGPKPAR